MQSDGRSQAVANRPVAVSRIIRGRFALHLPHPVADTLRRPHPEGNVDKIES